jgi:hypothetical protein
MWSCTGETLIPQYIKAFPKTSSKKLSPGEIVIKLEPCTEVLNNFEANLNSKLIEN